MDTKTCPECSKKMILVSAGMVLMSYPEQYPMNWWCKCGHKEAGPTIHGKTAEEETLEAWEEANK